MIFITAAFFYLLRGFFLFIRRKLKSLGSLVCYPPPPPPCGPSFFSPSLISVSLSCHHTTFPYTGDKRLFTFLFVQSGKILNLNFS